VGHAFAVVFLALLGFVALADAGAALVVLAATGLTDIETAECIEFRLLRLFLLVLFLVPLLLGVDSERAERRAEKRTESTTGQGAAETAPRRVHAEGAREGVKAIVIHDNLLYR
jgi:hypothetical protein